MVNMEGNVPNMILGGLKADGVVVPLPRIGMTFVSEKEMREYCTKYAESAGFDIAKRSTKCGDDGKQRYFSLACSRNGHTVYTSKNSLHQKSTSSKTNCKAKINVAVKSEDVFMITRVFLDHNHELTPGKARYFRYNKAFKPYCKRKLDLNEMASNHMCYKRSLNSIRVEASQHNNINNIVISPQAKKQRVFEESRSKSLLESGDADVLVSFFSGMQARDASFFYTIDVDEEGRIKNVFWADSRCRAAYESFSDVVIFDTTYLTSHDYTLPLVSFLGVNHHGQSILLGCGLIFSEETNSKTFIWLLKAWLTCMHGRQPKTLVFDEGKVLVQSAIAKVFPDSDNILCLSRVMDKLEGLRISKEIEKTLKNAVYGSFTGVEFEERWRKTIYEYNLTDNQWLRSLYEVRKCWVPVYTKSVFTAGLMSQKVAIAMEYFDGFVNPKTTLKQFVEQYEKVVERNVEKEKNADFASSSFVLPSMTNHPIEKQLQKVYTNDIFKQFQEEWRGLIFCNASLSRTNGSILTFDVAQSIYNEAGMFLKEMTCEVVLKEEQSQINCSCCLFESRGILCRHIISVLIKRNKHEVPSCYIQERWRKDIKRRYKDHVGHVSFNFNNISMERRRYDDLSPLLFDVQQIAIQSKEKCELLTKLLKQVKAKLVPVDIV